MKQANVRRSICAWIAAAAAAALLILPLSGWSQEKQVQEPEASDAFLTAKGRVTFRVYCANCHGPKGKGDGAVGELLKVKPPDLTQLAKRNGGKFPRAKVHAHIDGRESVKAHGNREMPIWGEAFQKTLQPTWKDITDEERAQYKIVEVVYFLASIQEDGD